MAYLNKRGEEASRIAPLILLIALVIVFYVLFLPPEVREELLGPIQPPEGGEEPGIAVPKEDVILRTSPGRLEKLDVREISNTFPPSILYSYY